MEIPNNKIYSEQRTTLRQRILQIEHEDFNPLALDIFRFQAKYNAVYREFLLYLNTGIDKVRRLTEIPFLPIQLFKQHTIRTGQPPVSQVIFESSGTTGSNTSRHHLHDAALYEAISVRIFEAHYGPLKNFHILALLPSYLERNNSSLVYMMDHFIKESGSEYSGFYLHDTQELLTRLRYLKDHPDGKQILLLGVTFALLDLAENRDRLEFLKGLPQLTVMDTGGMKGRRREMLREEVHDLLTSAFGVSKIHSEYGMTELLSQGYSSGDGLFVPGKTMRVLLRDINDPFSVHDQNISSNKTGGINVIDLANLDTCSFVETQDLGRYGNDANSFYVMGRFDNSDIRGCNLMIL
ncbi:acyl transferase [Dyadobacter helix]|uniref:acyl transferase n=1 Tax=Dyadobacter helix TaxID=2822344 RepID=UPI001BFC4FBC